MSVPPKAQAPRSVDRAFILVWGVEFIAYTLDITFFITIHTLFLAMNNYKDYILLFGDFEGQDVILFYASRIWIFQALLAVMQIFFGIAQTVEVYAGSWPTFIATLNLSPRWGLHCRDLTITATLCYILRQARIVYHHAQHVPVHVCDPDYSLKQIPDQIKAYLPRNASGRDEG
ncbi:hypothetical protein B0H14DRAFT_2653192 [Mycena olivaceomarginata]|nr:hypothetical protein B0H14DRAFT_2653192 [Mycena olivaceomarginata]